MILVVHFGLRSRAVDALRAYQKQQLCEDFDMMELTVFRERISKSFKNQVLATWVTNSIRNKDVTDISQDKLCGCSSLTCHLP